MAHFVKLDENNVVINGLVVNNNVLDPANEEQSGIEFLNTLFNTNDVWKQTSYNAAINGFRKNYAGIGYTYDATRDAFIAPKPDNATGFDEDTCRWIMPEVEFEA
jgi:hypothetical protein